ncbi:MAG TPA: FtsX-like permease family protein, partial [Bryobacteraceae bacterium]|nr:FtsX-like permease family protein [Bryobacteraceae bacterium]
LTEPGILDNRLVRFLHLIGRLKPGITAKQATAEVNLRFRQMVSDDILHPGPNGPIDAEDTALSKTAYVELNSAAQGISGLRTRYAAALKVLMAVVVLVLVIACANVANLLVAMGARRQREMAVRIAIGAGRRRVISQVLTEGLLLSAAAGVLGVLFASGAGRVLVHLISTGPRDLPLAFDLDPVVLAFTVGVSAATGVFFSLAPAIRAARVDLNSSLKEGKALLATPDRVTVGRALVVAQVALSLTLLVGSGLLVRSFRNLLTIGTGFERNGVLILKVDSEFAGYQPDGHLASLYTRIDERLQRLPGVAAAAISARLFHEGRQTESFSTPGLNLTQSERRIRQLNFISSDFFRALRIPIVAGRAFNSGDRQGTQYVAVVGANFAKQVFGGVSPVGRTIRLAPLDESHDYLIVGVAADIKYLDVREEPEKQVYLALAQNVVYARNIAVRVSGDQAQTAASVHSALRNIEPNLPVRWTTTLADEVSDSLVMERAVAQLASFFALVALLLSAMGLFGSISFAVARRTNEIGIRIALGAERSGVLGMVLRDTGTLLLAGVAAGLPLVFLAGRLIQSLLYGVTGNDPLTVLAAILLLAVTAAAAGYLPARRAASVDPTVALRCE